jgi:hypothetical protein
VNNSPCSAAAGPNLLRRLVTSIVACMRMVISGGSGVGAPAEAASLACGGTGLAGIGQLADIAIVQGPLRWARRSAHSLDTDRSRDRRTGPDGQASLPSWVRRELCGAGGGRLRPGSGGIRAVPRPPARYPRRRAASAASWAREAM